jgi:hypothetical protein
MLGGWRDTMTVQPTPSDASDQDQSKGAVESDRPADNQQGNENAQGALDSNGMPKDKVAIAEDVIGANVDETQG